MRRSLRAGVLVGFIIGLQSPVASAALLVSETFSYTNGNLVGHTPSPGPGGTWNAHSGSGVGSVQVTSGAASIVQQTGFNEDVNIPLNFTAGPGTVLFAAFDLTVTAPGPITPAYFGLFLQGTTNFVSRLWVNAPMTSGYTLTLSNNSTLANGTSWPADLMLGTTYRVVVSYDYTNQKGSMWVNPANISSPSITPTDAGFSRAVTAFAFRQATPLSESSIEMIDNLCVATTFDEVLNCNGPLQVAGSSNPSTVGVGEATFLTAAVSPPPGPTNSNIQVTGDLRNSIDVSLSNAQTFYDDGTHGDITPGDNIYSYSLLIPSNLSTGPGTKAIPVVATDAQGRSGDTSIALTVTCGTAGDCDDSNVCTTDTCDANHTCQHAPVTGNLSITGQPHDVVLCAGGQANFSVTATGTPAPAYQWETSSNGGSLWSNIGGATSAGYSFTTIAGDDGRQYRCLVSNVCSTVASAGATLTVVPPPQIDQQSGDPIVCTGADVTLWVEASNPLPLTFQWQVSDYSGTSYSPLLNGANNHYTFRAKPSDHHHKYRCAISNTWCTIYSTPVTLVVSDAAPPRNGTIELVSVSTSGQSGSGGQSVLSENARFVAFASTNDNLVDGDTNLDCTCVFGFHCVCALPPPSSCPPSSCSGSCNWPECRLDCINPVSNPASDIFIRDRLAGTTQRISVGVGGVQANDESFQPSISSDGRWVAFSSVAGNLPGAYSCASSLSCPSNVDCNASIAIYVRDMQTSTTTRLTALTAQQPVLSANGRHVAFLNPISSPLPPYTRNDVYVLDRDANGNGVFDETCTGCVKTTLVTVGPNGAASDGDSTSPVLSVDGRFLCFASRATNMVPNDTNGKKDVFLYDRDADGNGIFDEDCPGCQTLIRLSVAADGAEANGDSDQPRISKNGRYVIFESAASNLVTGDANNNQDIFVRDLEAGTIERVSVNSTGTEANGHCSQGVVSDNGRFMAFQSSATNLAAGATSSAVYLHDQKRGSTTLISTASEMSDISADGRYFAFGSYLYDRGLLCSGNGVLYVNGSAAPGGNGCGWATAFNDLETALQAAASDSGSEVQEIWVAAGTYTPTSPPTPLEGQPRCASFRPSYGLGVYGGFGGNETSREQRDPAAHPTILTNDPGNCQSVVTGPPRVNTHGEAVLDGFIIMAAQAPTGSVGEFLLEGALTISNCTILTTPERYLDLDPLPGNTTPPVLVNNFLQVQVPADPAYGTQGALLELRGLDLDCMSPACASGVLQTTIGNRFDGLPAANWVLDKLELLPNAKLNLTNRTGFQFQGDQTHPETVYVRQLVLGEGSVLNTALQTLYYETLSAAAGSQIVDEPLLGFSLVNVALDNQTEFNTRLRTRLRDEADTQPPYPAAPLEGNIVQIPDARGPGDGLMELRTQAPGMQSASSVAAKGAFARAGDEKITILFEYLFVENPDAEIVVYLSDNQDVGVRSFEVARVHMPTSGRPGSIGSNTFGVFYGTFPRTVANPPLNFVRGTHVELELRGLNAQGNTTPPVASRVWIDNFDPNITACCSCGDLNFNGCTADSQDYLVLLAEYGQALGQASLAKKTCLDQVYGGDHYVDLMDLLGWDSVMDADHPPPNACNIGIARADGTAGDKDLPPPHPLTATADRLLIAGKPNQPGQQFDYVYSIDSNGACAGVQAPAGADSADPTSRSNGRLIQDHDGNIYQLHGALGLLRTGSELVGQRQVIPPRSFSITGGTLYVGIHSVIVNEESGATPPLADVAFGRTESTRDFAYALPVVVIPQNTSQCPYRVAAKLQLERGTNGVFNGNYTLITLYGQNPADDPECTITSESCTVGQTTDVQHLREIEIDASGNLFILAAQALTPNNNWLLIYNENTGNSSEKRVPLSVPSPSALLWSATDNKLYLTSSINSIPDPNNNNRPGGDVDVFSYNVPGVLAYVPPAPPAPQVGVTPNATTRINYPVGVDLGFGYVSTVTSFVEIANNLYALGFTMPRFDPNISPNNSVFSGTTGTINAAPALAIIDLNANPPTASGTPITCNNLGLPVSAIYTPISISRWRSVRTHGGADLSIELNPLATGNGVTGPTVETRSGGIQKIEVDFNSFVAVNNATNITVSDGAAGYTPAVSASGSTLTLNFAPALLPDQKCYTLTIGPAALLQTVTGNKTCRIRSLQGDGTGNGIVNLGDVLYTKKQIGQPAAALPHIDYDLTGGTIDAADMLTVKPRVSSPAMKALCP